MGNYAPDSQMVNPVKSNGMGADKMAAALVIGSLVLLIAIRRGFSGVSVGSLSGGLVRP